MLRDRDCTLLYPGDPIEYKELLQNSLVGRLDGTKEFKTNAPMDAPNDMLELTMSDVGLWKRGQMQHKERHDIKHSI